MKLVGRMLSSILCVILLLNSVGCTGTEGSFYPMVNGYAVCRVSNLDVPLIYNENWEDEANEVWGGVIVLHDYYVKGFRYNEEYVAVSGIYAQDCEATEEELNTSPVVYYLIYIVMLFHYQCISLLALLIRLTFVLTLLIKHYDYDYCY